MGLLKDVCSMLAGFSIARCFSYTRLLEKSQSERETESRKRLEDERAVHQEQINFLTTRIIELRADLQAERALSRIDHEGLLDRALARNGVKPIHLQEEKRQSNMPKQVLPEYEAAVEEARESHHVIRQQEKDWAQMLEAARAVNRNE